MDSFSAADFRKLVYGHLFLNGVQAACGVVGLTTLFYFLTDLPTTLAMATGLLCVSVVDVPSPRTHKVFEMLAAVALGSLVTLVMAAASERFLLSGMLVMLISFFAAMLNAYGKKALPLSFATFFVMVIALGKSAERSGAPLTDALLFAIGGLSYTAYALLAASVVAWRNKQQTLADALFALAGYLRAKTAFYEDDADLDRCYRTLVTQQIAVVDKLQTAREFVFRHLRASRDARLARVLLGALDVYEYILSSHTDYKRLQQQFGGTDLLMFLRDLTDKAARDLESVAFAILRDTAPRATVNYKAELLAIEHELDRAGGPGQRADTDAQRQALAVIVGTRDRIRLCIDGIAALRDAIRSDAQPADITGQFDLRAFLTPASANPGILLAQLNVAAPVFRHAVRTTLAMGCGYLIGELLPYSTHGYWILLTVAVIMRASFSLTRQRRIDRVVGNIAGCIFTAVLLHFHPGALALLGVIFVALAITHTFATIQYRYASTAACVTALVQIQLLNASTRFAIGERLLDTLIGASLAFLFSYVFPSWERQHLPRQIVSLLRANARYAQAILDPAVPDAAYRLARKQVLDMVAILTGTFRRMLEEPATQWRADGALQDFITRNYMFAAHLAALRLLLRRRGGELDLPLSTAHLGQARERIATTLGAAMRLFEGGAASQPAAAPAATGVVVPPSPATATAMLDRRLSLILNESDEILAQSAEVSRAWRER